MNQRNGPKDRLPPKIDGSVLNMDRKKPIEEGNNVKGLTLLQFLEFATNIASVNNEDSGATKERTQSGSGQVSSLANLQSPFKLKPESK